MNPQTTPSISCDVAIYLISLALMIPLNTMANWVLPYLFISLCISTISIRRVCEQKLAEGARPMTKEHVASDMPVPL
jgi:hypothetical protein